MGTENTQKWKNTGLWAIQILGAALFLFAGSGKLLGNPQMVEVFKAIGLGHWFRILTGIIECVCASLLLVPALCGLGALFLVGTMTGAVITHFFVIGGNPAAAIISLILMVIVAYGRRERTFKILRLR